METQFQDHDFKVTVYGWLYRLFFGTIVVNQNSAKSTKPPRGYAQKLKSLLPVLLIVPIFVVRIFFLVNQMNKTKGLTRDWAFCLATLLLTVHGLISTIFLAKWNAKNLLYEFPRQLHSVLGHKVKKSTRREYKKGQIMQTAFFLFFVITFLFVGLENWANYDAPTLNSNGTAFYRQSITDTRVWWGLDAFMMTWASFMSVIALIIFYLTLNAQCIEMDDFNKELQGATQSSQLQHSDLWDHYGQRHLELIKVFKYANEQFGGFATASLMFGSVVHVSCVFIMRSYSEELDVYERVHCLFFLVLSLLYLFITIKTPAALHSSMNNTKQQILFETRDLSDVKMNSVVNAVVQRINEGDYQPIVLDGIKFKPLSFHQFFMLYPLIVEILNLLKP